MNKLMPVLIVIDVGLSLEGEAISVLGRGIISFTFSMRTGRASFYGTFVARFHSVAFTAGSCPRERTRIVSRPTPLVRKGPVGVAE